MDLRITEKEVSIKNRNFTLKKYDPYFGTYIAMQIFGNMGKNKSIEDMVQTFALLPQEQFQSLQKQVLSYCFERLPSGLVKITQEDGNFAIMNFTAPMALSLFMQSMIFNLTDFFDQEVIGGLEESIKEEPEQVLPQTK